MTIETRTAGPVTTLDIHGKITIGEGSAEVCVGSSRPGIRTYF